MKHVGWEVRFFWKDVRGTLESGANTSFPEGTGVMDVIAEVAKWRGVDLGAVHSVDAHQTDHEWDDGK